MHIIHLGSLAISVLCLSACSTMSDLAPGTPLSSIEQQYGRPASSCTMNSSTRHVWSTQPMGQYAWALDIGADNALLRSEQILNDRAFAQLTDGNWQKQDVLCYFGPPAEKDITPYRGVKMEVWSYRYKQNKTWDSMMHIYFDAAGYVVHHHPGPDPLYHQDGFFMIP